MKINITNDLSVFKGTNERCVTIGGSAKNICNSIFKILGVLPNKGDGQPDSQYWEQIIIPWNSAGKLIGKVGSNVKRLNDEYHVEVGSTCIRFTQIRISSDTETPSDHRNRSVLIIGSPENVTQASHYIKDFTGGNSIENYPGDLSIRMFVPIQAFYRLCPQDSSKSYIQGKFPSVVITPSPDFSACTGFSTRGVDLAGPGGAVADAKRQIESMVRDWVVRREIVACKVELGA